MRSITFSYAASASWQERHQLPRQQQLALLVWGKEFGNGGSRGGEMCVLLIIFQWFYKIFVVPCNCRFEAESCCSGNWCNDQEWLSKKGGPENLFIETWCYCIQCKLWPCGTSLIRKDCLIGIGGTSGLFLSRQIACWVGFQQEIGNNEYFYIQLDKQLDTKAQTRGGLNQTKCNIFLDLHILCL